MTQKHPQMIASLAQTQSGAKMYAPSAARNASAVVDMVATYAPDAGAALEIASGTGQHVALLAQRLPHLFWQPTEPDAAKRQSIDAYAADSRLPNIAPAQNLDATLDGWHTEWPDQSLICLTNLLHLISEHQTQKLIRESARALAPGGRFIAYGPFRRAGALTSQGDAEFDATLRANNPDLGYKNDNDIISLLHHSGLHLVKVVDMPANNLAFVAEYAMPKT